MSFVVVAALSCLRLSAQARCPEDSRADDLATRFVIDGGAIKMPIGAFLLVRKDHQLGAIRLTKVSPASTEWLGQSAYESYFQPDGSNSLLAANVVRQTGELELKDSKGPGRGIFIYRPGPYFARIGKWSFGFDGPSMMPMTDHSALRGDYSDLGFEFAPTSACRIDQINTHDKRLRWFRYDPNASVVLPLAELPK